MLIKTGDAEILGVLDPSDIEDDDTRKSTLATALEKAKEKLSAKDSTQTIKAES